MQLKKLLEDIEIIEKNVDEDLEITSMSRDFHKVKTGGAFIGLIDGELSNNFYLSLIKRGVAVIITFSRPKVEVPYVLVKRKPGVFNIIIRNYYDNPGSKMKIIGVTGTNGKTSSTMLLKHILEQVCNTKVGLIGTVENLIGDVSFPTERTTPVGHKLQKLLAKMYEAGCEYVVMEVTSHSLVQHRVAGIHYSVGSFTNLTEDHLDYHRTMENYCKAKAQLFDQCDKAIGNLDDEWFEKIRKKAPCDFMTFSVKEKADLRAEDISLFYDRTCFTVIFEGKKFPVTVPIPGIFTVYNVLNALGMALLLDLPLEKAIASLCTFKGVKGRLELVPTLEKQYQIFIDYAHTPDGLEKALLSARSFSKGRVIVIFGCGGCRDVYKRPIMGKIGTDLADFAIITSDNPRFEDPKKIISQIVSGIDKDKQNFVVIEDRTEAIHYALKNAQEQDVIILAGKGHETSQDLGFTEIDFDERKIIQEFYENNK